MSKMSDERKQYLAQYQKEHLKRIPLDVKPEFFAAIREHARTRGLSVNSFIRLAIRNEIISYISNPTSDS